MKRNQRRSSRPAWGQSSRCPTSGKVRHTDRREAKYWAGRLHEGDSRVNVYQCRDCGFWHLGHIHESGTRHPFLRCTIDTAPVFDDESRAHAYAERLGPSGVVAPCGDHWHVCLLPAV